MTIGLTGWEVEGVNVRTAAINIFDVEGWDAFQTKRGGNPRVAYQDGSMWSGQKYFDQGDLALIFVVLDNDAAGGITHPGGAYGELQDNIDALKGIHHSDTLLDIRKTVPNRGAAGTHERRVMGEPLGFAPFQSGPGITRTFLARYAIPYPHWQELPVRATQNLGVGAETVDRGGTAPISDSVVTISGAGRITIDATGRWIENLASGVLIVDMSGPTLEVTKAGAPAPNDFDYAHPELLRWPANQDGSDLAVGVTTTVACDVDLFDEWL